MNSARTQTRITKDILADRMLQEIGRGRFTLSGCSNNDLEAVWCELKTERCGKGWERFAQNSYAHGGKLVNGPRDAWLEEVSDIVSERVG